MKVAIIILLLAFSNSIESYNAATDGTTRLEDETTEKNDETTEMIEDTTTIHEDTTHKNEDTTPEVATTTTQDGHYNCLDIAVDNCPDETLDEIGTFSDIQSLEDCMFLCDLVYKDLCNSYIYFIDTKTCRVLRDEFSSYLPECATFGAGQDTVQTCLTDDELYPDPCKNMLESECKFEGTVLATISEVLKPEECLMASQIFHGSYYVHDDVTQICNIYNSNQRTCNVERGLAGLSNCPA